MVKFHFTEEEVKHYFLPRDKIIYTYVVDRPEIVEGKKKSHITDLISFYSLPSHVMNNPKHNMLYVSHSNLGVLFLLQFRYKRFFYGID